MAWQPIKNGNMHVIAIRLTILITSRLPRLERRRSTCFSIAYQIENSRQTVDFGTRLPLGPNRHEATNSLLASGLFEYSKFLTPSPRSIHHPPSIPSSLDLSISPSLTEERLERFERLEQLQRSMLRLEPLEHLERLERFEQLTADG
jgi:hypothetical protein